MNKENRTITDEQLKDMTVDDMVAAINFCDKHDHEEKDAEIICFELMKNLNRIVYWFNFDEDELRKVVAVYEKEWENERDKVRDKDHEEIEQITRDIAKNPGKYNGLDIRFHSSGEYIKRVK